MKYRRFDSDALERLAFPGRQITPAGPQPFPLVRVSRANGPIPPNRSHGNKARATVSSNHRMKTQSLWILASLSGSMVGVASFGQDSHAPAAPNPPAAVAQVHTGAASFGENTDPAFISSPPPKPLKEKKPDAPGPMYAWVPGHYTPVKGEWRWIAGKWSMPPTVESVWIEGTYDAPAKHWSEGHWQPDGNPTPKTEPAKSGPAAAGK